MKKLTYKNQYISKVALAAKGYSFVTIKYKQQMSLQKAMFKQKKVEGWSQLHFYSKTTV